MRTIFLSSILLSALSLTVLAADLKFDEVVIDPAAAKKAVYAVAVADVDGDGRLDIVSVNENQVLWYQAPNWKKRIIIEDQTELDNVCIAPHDIDGDGKIDFALGAGWTKVGTIQWLSRGASLDEKWHVHTIGVEPWTHRMRWADVLGTGRPQLVVSPLNATQGNGVRLLAFEVPANPQSDPWPSTVLDDALNRMHNHWHVEHGDERRIVTVTASQEGLHAIWRKDDGTFGKRQIGSGMPGDKPDNSGAGEVKIGRFQGGRPFMATIEPMHGTTVAVYTAPDPLPEGQLADRHVLDDSLKQGHGVWTADLDGDGGDEIVIGHREAGDGPVKGPGVYVFTVASNDGSRWTKHVIDDGGMACEDLLCADLDGDGKLDILAGGRATLNLKLYLKRR
jgi:hypothetical protein